MTSFPVSPPAIGQVVGQFPVGQGRENGYRTRPGQPFDPAIDGIGSFGFGSQAESINNLGVVTGYLDQAIRLNPGETVSLANRLGTLGGSNSFGRDINDLGQVVGESLIAGNQFNHAFRTAPNAKINVSTDDLGTLGGNNSFALAINASGMVVGQAHVNAAGNIRRAFRTKPNQPIDPLTDDLGTLGGLRSTATDINDAGWVVGTSTIDPANPNSNHAFVFDDTTMWDLNDLIDPSLGIQFRFAEGINNSGQILVEGFGIQYLLTPIPVPEPSSLLLCAIGTSTVICARYVKGRRSPRRNLRK